MGRRPTYSKRGEKSRQHSSSRPVLQRRFSAKPMCRKPQSIRLDMLHMRQRLASARCEPLCSRSPEMKSQCPPEAEDSHWFSSAVVSPVSESWAQLPPSPSKLPGPGTPIIAKHPPTSPSPWARSGYLYQSMDAVGTGQDTDDEMVIIDPRIHQTWKSRQPKTEKASWADNFDAEWEAFEKSMMSQPSVDLADECNESHQNRPPGWPNCPFCGEGHDPCLPCFS